MLGKKIVVVDDEESIRRTFFLILNKKYRVYLAKDAREALDRFRRAKIDLIIADLKLPQTSGLDMIAKFRESGYKGQAILISAHADLVKLDELKQLAVGYFFVKPLDLNAILRSVDYLLDSEGREEKRI
jgi:DNA-binding NtrC family response regulator